MKKKIIIGIAALVIILFLGSIGYIIFRYPQIIENTYQTISKKVTDGRNQPQLEQKESSESEGTENSVFNQISQNSELDNEEANPEMEFTEMAETPKVDITKELEDTVNKEGTPLETDLITSNSFSEVYLSEKNLKCTSTFEAEGETLNTIRYFKDKMVFNVVYGPYKGEDTVTYSIYKDSKIYSWGAGLTNGTVINQEDTIPYRDDEMTYTCTEYELSNSLFEVPTNINFEENTNSSGETND